MAQKMFKPKITPAGGDFPVEVTVPANESSQAKRMIESQFGPIKTWWGPPPLSSLMRLAGLLR